MADARSCNWKLFNIIFMGIAFMFLFTAFQTCCMVEQTVINETVSEPNTTFSGSGYTSLSIIYAVFAGSNWFAPPIIAVLGPKWSMFVGAACYCLFIASFLKPMTWALYLGSVLVGIGAAVLWTAQGNFLTLNSDVDTIGRNSGIFWALLQCSLLFGNLYIYFEFSGMTGINSHTRVTLFAVLSSVAVAGLLMIIIFRKPGGNDADNSVNLNASQSAETQATPLEQLKKSFKLLCTREMILLSFTFAYTGFELSFWSGVYGTSVAATNHFGTLAKSLIGLVGIFIGVGEIIGGALFGLLGKKTNHYGRDPIILLGFLSHVAAMYLVYLNLPEDSPLRNSSAPTYMTPNKYIVLTCAFLFGLGDSSFNTQIFSLIGSMFPDDSAPAFALYKFVQSLASAIAFVYSQYLFLQWQLLIMTVFAVVGSLTFFVVEWSATRAYRSGYSQI